MDTGLFAVRIHNGVTPGGNIILENGSQFVANLATAATNITTLFANAATQTTLINTINANIVAANAAIITANTTQSNQITSLQSQLTGANAAIVTANTALKSYTDNQISTAINNLIDSAPGTLDTLAEIAANLLSSNSAIGSIVNSITVTNANVTAANAAIITANTAMKGYVDAVTTAWTANAGVQADSITSLTANAATQNSSINSINANVGGFYTYANLNYSTSSYSNTNLTAYLSSQNISSANIGGGQLYANTQIDTINANIGSYYISANANVAGLYNSILGANTAWTANAASQAGLITTLQSNAGVQADAIVSLTANAGVQADAIVSLTANAGVQADAIVSLTANAGAQADAIVSLTANAGVQSANIVTLTANAGAQADAIVSLTANAGAQTDAIAGANVAITTANTALKGYVDTQLSNLTAGASTALDTLVEIGTALGNNANFSGVMVTWLGNLDSKITGANTAISTLQANVGSFYTWANTNFGTSSYGNTNANALLSSNTISTINTTGDIKTIANIIGTTFTFANGVNILSTATGLYSNNTVISLLPTYTGNIAGNIVKSGYAWRFGTDGNLTIPENINFANGVNILSTATGLYSNNTVISFMPTYTGNIAGNIVKGGYAYRFGTDGNLTLPETGYLRVGAGITYANGTIILDGIGGTYSNTTVAAYLTGNTISTINTTGNITTIANVISPNYLFANGVNILSTITAVANLSNLTGNISWTAVGATPPTFTTASNGTKIVLWPSISSTMVDYAIGIEGGNTWFSIPQAANNFGYKWYAGNTAIATLSGNGTLTTGNITTTGNVSATNFVGNGAGLTGVALKTTGSWTVTTGTGTYSFTVPASGTYQLWADCNIPNGILVWNATATVTNTNVPVVGAQYAWVYSGGGTPIDFTSIPNQFVGTANTIVRSNTAPSSTTNRFDFGINNTSGGNVAVRYGWVAII
jgi:hypothetical protein